MTDLATFVEANGGYLMRHQLLDLGYSDPAIRAAVRDGALFRVRHGTYVWRAVWDALTPDRQLQVATYSVLDKLGPGVVATHQSAVAIHGFEQYDADLTKVHLTRLDGGPGRREAGVTYHHGHIDPVTDLMEIDGRLVTVPMRAVFEASSLGNIESAMVVVSSALRRDTFTKDELNEVGRQFAHWSGTRKVRIAIRLSDARLETVGEVRSLHMMWKHHVPYPEMQWIVLDRNGREIARTDFAWIEACHTGEFDGLIKYGKLNPNLKDPGRVVVKEKDRENRVREQSLGMSRWGWADLVPKNQPRTAKRILQGIEQSKRLYAHGAVHISLG